MLKTSIKNNILSILRDPTTILALLAAIIMRFMYGFDMYTDPSGNHVDTELFLSEYAMSYALNSFVGFVISSLRNMAFPFLGIIVAINLFKDIRTNMFDILSTGQLSFRKYFFSKIISYYILGVLLCLFLTVTYSILYAIVQIPPKADLEWGKIILAQIVAIIVVNTAYLLIPIAWAIFLSALTGVPAVGVIFDCMYLYIPGIIAGFKVGYTFWDHYIHVFPHTMQLYLLQWITYPTRSIFTMEYRDQYAPEAYQMFTSFKDASLSFLLQLIITGILFTISYYLLKRRFAKA